MKRHLLTLGICAALIALAAPSFAESYPGADRQEADKLENATAKAIESARQHHVDTRDAEYFFNQGRWDISQGESVHAQRDFKIAQDALRPAPAAPAAALGTAPMPHPYPMAGMPRHHHHHHGHHRPHSARSHKHHHLAKKN